MSIFRALNLLSAIEYGNVTSAELDTTLVDPGRYSEWELLCSMETQFIRMMADGVRDVVLGSTLAWRGLASAMRPLIYAPETLAELAPSAWAVYVPHVKFMPRSTTYTLLSWLNACNPATRSLNRYNAQSEPVLDYSTGLLGIQPVPSFNGTTTRVRTDTVFSQTTYTIFMVYRRQSIGPVGNCGLISTDVTGTTVAQGYYTNGAANMNATNTNVAGGFTGAPPAPVGEWGLSRFRKVSAALAYHSLNGGPESVMNPGTATPAFTNGSGVALGWHVFGFMHGHIAEVWLLADNAEENSPEVQRVTAMLKAKYSL